VYLISGNLAEISLVFFATLFHLPFILLPTQILWMNLVTDSLPAIALATGNKDGAELFKKPRNPQGSFLDMDRILLILLIGLSISTVLLGVFTYLLGRVPEAVARTVVFDLLIFFHMGIVIALGWHSIKKGHFLLIFTVLLIIFLQLLITFTPFFQAIFHLQI